MRADRLLSLLLLLQTRGRMSAPMLAKELEVSERTIYRDIEALTIAGVPIYAETGVKGGFALLDSYRTSLTGMNEEEVRALFMLAVPAPLADLGVSQELRSALLKLSAALPDSQRQDEGYIRQRIHLDAKWWYQGGESIAHLPTIQRAVWQDWQLNISYEVPYAPQIRVNQCIDPYGLVAKAGVWYVVYARNGRFQAKRVSQLQTVQLQETAFTRDMTFDLVTFWQNWCDEFENQRIQYPVKLRVASRFVAQLPYHFGEAVNEELLSKAEKDDAGSLLLTVPFESLESAREKLLGLGNAVEVIAPVALRLSIADYAQQIVDLYDQ